MTLAEAVKCRILSLCETEHITLNRLSYRCGMTQSTLNNIVNGGSRNPKLSTIKKICDGLDISLAEFFASEEFNDLEQEIQ